MTKKESLLLVRRVLNHTYSGHEIHHLSRSSVVQVVAALVATVAVDPFQSKLAGGCCLVGHFSQHLLEDELLVGRTKHGVAMDAHKMGFEIR